MEDIKKEDFLESRCYFYHFFAQVLYQVPSKEKMQELIHAEIIDRVLSDQEISLVNQNFFGQVAAMRRYKDIDWDNLAQEYIRLFAGAERVLVYPWESVYMSREHIIFDEHTLAVQEFYESWGVTAPDRSAGPADHIGLECSFIKYLSELALTAIHEQDHELTEKILIAQKEFLENHLCLFLEKFCTLLEQQTNNTFYQHFSFFLKSYILVDLSILNEFLNIE